MPKNRYENTAWYQTIDGLMQVAERWEPFRIFKPHNPPGRPSDHTPEQMRSLRRERGLYATVTGAGALVAAQTLLPSGVTEAINDTVPLTMPTDHPVGLFVVGMLLSATGYKYHRQATYEVGPIRYVHGVSLLEAPHRQTPEGTVHTITSAGEGQLTHAVIKEPMPFMDGEVVEAPIQ